MLFLRTVKKKPPLPLKIPCYLSVATTKLGRMVEQHAPTLPRRWPCAYLCIISKGFSTLSTHFIHSPQVKQNLIPSTRNFTHGLPNELSDELRLRLLYPHSIFAAGGLCPHKKKKTWALIKIIRRY